MQIVVDLLHPKPWHSSLVGIAWHKRRRGERLIEVLDDDSRFDNGPSVMHQCWHDGIWVELSIFRIELITTP